MKVLHRILKMQVKQFYRKNEKTARVKQSFNKGGFKLD